MRAFGDDEDSVAPVLGSWAYLTLAILDLATTTVLLRAFPGQAAEANDLLAGVIDTHGLDGLWLVKLSGAALAAALYLGLRLLHPAAGARRLADLGIVACCVLQGAIVLSNVAAFVVLTG